MPRLPRLTGKELIKCLKGHEFAVARVHGSHHVMQHPDGRQTVVPVHAGEIIGRLAAEDFEPDGTGTGRFGVALLPD